MDSEESFFIQYELLQDNEPKATTPEESRDQAARESLDEQHIPEMHRTSEIPSEEMPMEEEGKWKRTENMNEILDSIFAPSSVFKDGARYLKKLSREPVTAEDVKLLSKQFEETLEMYGARIKGFCRVRRKLHDFLFDELIRQTAIDRPERGALLLDIRNHFQRTLLAYNKLLDSGIEYGCRKTLELECTISDVQNQYKKVKDEAEVAEKQVQMLEEEIAKRKQLAKEKTEEDKSRHTKKMIFLQKTNQQLKDRLRKKN